MQATDTIPGLRRAARAAAGSNQVLIGGEVAEAYDTREALKRDTWLIVPIGLALILLILIVLLRAIVMPLYVIGTVILSFAFALGVSSLIFTHVMDQPGSDRTLEQFAFIFLVALGVDYNVFLLARIREERDRMPGHEGRDRRRARADRRRDHQRRARARGHLQRADGAAARVAVPGRVRRRARPARRHVPGARSARPVARRPARRVQLVAEPQDRGR